MKCPNCGYKRQKRDDAFVPTTECPSCGIVYAKHESIASPVLPNSAGSVPPVLRPSAVDPESLRKAQDRVEKRLRDRMEVHVKDDRHARTLELARKITGRAPIKKHLAEDQPSTPIIVADKKPEDHPTTEGHAPEPESEEVLELEEAIGVQLHNVQNDTTPETSDQALQPDTQEATADETDTPAESAQDTPVDASAETAIKPDQVSHTDAKPDLVINEDFDEETDLDLDTTAEDSADEDAPDDITSDEDVIDEDASNPGTPITEEEPPGNQTSDYPDDVEVKTVILESDTPASEQNAFQNASKDESTSTHTTTSNHGQTENSENAVPLIPGFIATEPKPPGIRLDFGLKRLLPVVAWLLLFSGVVGAVLSWTTINEVEAGVNIPVSNGLRTLPLGLLLGFAYLATGALGFAFFWVASLIGRQLKDIHHLLVHPCAMPNENTLSETQGIMGSVRITTDGKVPQ